MALAVAYAGLMAVLFFAQRALLYPGASGGPISANHWGQAEDIVTADGERLLALHSPARQGHPTVLYFHGNADRVDRYEFLARSLAERGTGLLALSYRGYPGSTGMPTETGLIADGIAAHDWLVSRSGGPVILLGQSLGSGVAVAVAAQRRVAGLALISAYDSVLELARRTYFFLPVAPFLKDPFRSDLRIRGIDAPKLFIHGRMDTLVPVARGAALFDAAPEPKRMLILDEAGHNDIWSERALREIADFADSVAKR